VRVLSVRLSFDLISHYSLLCRYLCISRRTLSSPVLSTEAKARKEVFRGGLRGEGCEREDAAGAS
jgi:hypothetical protein